MDGRGGSRDGSYGNGSSSGSACCGPCLPPPRANSPVPRRGPESQRAPLGPKPATLLRRGCGPSPQQTVRGGSCDEAAPSPSPRRSRGCEYSWAVVYTALLWDCVCWITQQRRLCGPTQLSANAWTVLTKAREAVGDAWQGLVERCSSSVEVVLERRYLKMCAAGGSAHGSGGAAAGAPEPHTTEWMWENAVGKRVVQDAVRDLLQLRNANNGTDLDDLSVKCDIATEFDRLDVGGLAREAWRKLETCAVPRPGRAMSTMPKSRGESTTCVRYRSATVPTPCDSGHVGRGASAGARSVSMTGSMDVNVNVYATSDDDDATVDGAAKGNGGSDVSHPLLRQERSSRCAHFVEGVHARRGGAAAAMAGSDDEMGGAFEVLVGPLGQTRGPINVGDDGSEVTDVVGGGRWEAGAVGAEGRCDDNDVDISAAAGCADDGILAGASVRGARGGGVAAASEGRTGTCVGAVPAIDGPCAVADGSIGAGIDAERVRHCLQLASSESEGSKADGVDSTGREGGGLAATAAERCTNDDDFVGTVPGALGPTGVSGSGSVSAVALAEGERHCPWRALSTLDSSKDSGVDFSGGEG